SAVSSARASIVSPGSATLVCWWRRSPERFDAALPGARHAIDGKLRGARGWTPPVRFGKLKNDAIRIPPANKCRSRAGKSDRAVAPGLVEQPALRSEVHRMALSRQSQRAGHWLQRLPR